MAAGSCGFLFPPGGGEVDRECRPLPRWGVHEHQPPVRVHRALHDGEAQAGAAHPTGHERLEQAGPPVLGGGPAAVAHRAGYRALDAPAPPPRAPNTCAGASPRRARPASPPGGGRAGGGFLLGAAGPADAPPPAWSGSARGGSSSSRFESEISVKIAVTRGSPAGSTSSVVVVTPIGKVRSGRRTVASTRIARTPRRAVAVIAAQNSGATFANSGMIGRPRHWRSLNPRICSAAGLQYSRWPA